MMILCHKPGFLFLQGMTTLNFWSFWRDNSWIIFLIGLILQNTKVFFPLFYNSLNESNSYLLRLSSHIFSCIYFEVAFIILLSHFYLFLNISWQLFLFKTVTYCFWHHFWCFVLLESWLQNVESVNLCYYGNIVNYLGNVFFNIINFLFGIILLVLSW